MRVESVLPPDPAKPRTKSEGGIAFALESDFTPTGDQPQAIAELTEGLKNHEREQVLLGVTGSGKTFTMAQVITRVQRPALILAPNKTLAAQLYGEMRGFFPHNAVEYFVSYYDYYQPEAYVPRTDTFVEKDASINEQIDRMRHSATRALLERDDVIIVASVSCIYGIGAVETYQDMALGLERGQRIERGALLKRLIEIQYRRNDTAFQRAPFGARRRRRGLPRAPRGPGLAAVAVRRRARIDHRVRSPDRGQDRDARIGQDLRQQPLRHAAPDASASGTADKGGPGGAA